MSKVRAGEPRASTGEAPEHLVGPTGLLTRLNRAELLLRYPKWRPGADGPEATLNRRPARPDEGAH